MSDEINLIRETLSGNMGAFSQLVQRHRGRVVRTACGIVGSTERAEDVAQDVFVKVWQKLPDYRGQASFTTWLYRITINTAIDATRRQRPDTTPLEEWHPSPQPSPEEDHLRAARGEQVRAAIATLPDGARAALVLREYEQLSYKEIAHALGIPIGTVMSRINYARQALKKRLSVEPQVEVA